MATYVLTDCKLWLDGQDFSGLMNALALTDEADAVEETGFGDTTHQFIAGLRAIRAEHRGYWEGGGNKIDDRLFSKIGAAAKPMTIAPETGTEGKIAYTFNPSIAVYTPGAAVGEMFGFGVSAQGAKQDRLVRATILHNANEGGSGNGTAFNLGAVGASQKLYAALHVVGIGAGTVVVKVQSDDASGFLSPTDRITFAGLSAAGSEWAAPVAGAISDTWWRVTWDQGANFIAVVGIL